jgi:hypothetical protein
VLPFSVHHLFFLIRTVLKYLPVYHFGYSHSRPPGTNILAVGHWQGCSREPNRQLAMPNEAWVNKSPSVLSVSIAFILLQPVQAVYRVNYAGQRCPDEWQYKGITYTGCTTVDLGVEW